MAIERHVPLVRDLAGPLHNLGADTLCVSSADILGESYDTGDAPDCVVLGIAGADRGARTLLDSESADWMAAADRPQLEMLQVLQSVRRRFADRTLSIVMVGASLGLTGAAGHTALATATEGQRGMMKSLARQWGPDFRLNWLAVSTPLIFPEIDPSDLPEQVELGDYVPSLKRRPTLDDVAKAVMMFASPLSAFVTGQSLTIDGGEWMLS